jgi:hypothetical protein
LSLKEDRKQGSDEECSKEAAPEHDKSLVGPEEWSDPPECETISEFHKDIVPEESDEDVEDSDLEAWIDYWQGRSSYKVLSEYHKEGAPYLDDAFVDEAQDGQEGPPKVLEGPPPEKPVKGPKPHVEPEEKPLKRSPPKISDIQVVKDKKTRKKGPERVIDITTIEFLAFTVIRAIFPKRVRYVLKKEGLVDMDVAIDDRDIIFNWRRLMFEVPELSVWKLIFAYKGKPVVEFGRGVKNGLKIYRLRVIRVLFDMWLSGRSRRRKQEEKDREDMEALLTRDDEAAAKKKKKKKKKKKRKTK